MRANEFINEACWSGYKQVGMKKKGTKTVPNCVPVEENASGDSSLHDWFSKSKASDGTKGWVQIGGKYAGKPCAKQPGQTTKPKCGSSKMKRNLNAKEEEAAARRKRREDPNPNRRGKAKNVATKTNEGQLQPNDMIDWHTSGNTAWVNMISIPQSQRGQGFGKQVYLNWEKQLPSKIKLIRLMAANTGSGTSSGFWDRMGFDYTYTGESLPYETAMMMWKGVNGHPTPDSIQGDDEESQQIDEKWSKKYKDSINCSNPKGFSQRAHCQGKKK